MPAAASLAPPDAVGPAFREVAVARCEDGFDAVAADPHRQRRLWAASGARVLVSDDGGLSWRERFRLPGLGAGTRGAAGEDGAAPGPGRATTIAADLDDEGDATALDEVPDVPLATRRAGLPDDMERRPATRIHGLRFDGVLWIAAADAAYRWTDARSALERFAIPGGADVLAAVPDPRGGAAAWLATSIGLWRVDGAQVTRARGLVGVVPATDADAVKQGDGAVIAVASPRGLFVSADGGARFAGPLSVAGLGGPVAVRLDNGGRGWAVSRDGALASFDREGRVEAGVALGLAREVRRLHLAGAGRLRRLWLATADGLFRRDPDGTVARVIRGLPTADVRDVVTPAGAPDSPLVATDPGLFVARPAPSPGPRRPPGRPRGRGPATASGPVAMPPLPLVVGDAEVALGLTDLDLRGRAGLAPLLPSLDASFGAAPRVGAGDRDTWSVVARWDLAALFGPADAAVSAAERRLYRARRSLRLVLERALRARSRLLGAAGASGDEVDDALAALAVDEQDARLDGLTGGRFTARLDREGGRSPW